ncbi:hypothetical protein BJ993_004835 [Nocardioides aromaticivorans]|uniref:Uncharacterized protein n=1 Tax=Nocardioides aromaticivorans TaxID=200618 RepID=A0A7Y9ZPK1_9ACTN|nr:hypothetical protein [Nocardioides aromaticivorans]NYI47755.1 hypothetical protein [Nocardioides aromaticivorans]QSR26879.1 hypothetical protein CFH99_14710 [Nocardioides aromaticivorans]
MSYLMLYGSGWTQRWRIAVGMEDDVRSQISQVGNETTGVLNVLDPGSDNEATLVVSWARVAAAVVLDTAAEETRSSTGQYA